jgi:ligand-binding SRPBCC domain-containing protein
VARVTTITTQTFVKAPPEICFDLALDVQEHAKSLSYSDEHIVDGMREGIMRLGDTMTLEGRHFGVLWRLGVKVVELERPNRFVDVMVSGPFKSVRHEHSFEQREGGTLVQDTFAFAAPFGPIGWAVERLILRRHMTKLLARRNSYLKALAERRAAS